MKNVFFFSVLPFCTFLMGPIYFSPAKRDHFFLTACEIMTFQHYWGFVTIDSLGNSYGKILTPFSQMLPSVDALSPIGNYKNSRNPEKFQCVFILRYCGIHDTLVGYVFFSGKARLIKEKCYLKQKLRLMGRYYGLGKWDGFCL